MKKNQIPIRRTTPVIKTRTNLSSIDLGGDSKKEGKILID